MDEVEGEEPEGALERGLHDLAVGGVEGEDQGLEDEIGVGEGEAEQGGGGIRRGGGGLELVEGGFAGGDDVGVLAPGGVLDDLVEGGADHAAAAGLAAEGLGGRRHWGGGGGGGGSARRRRICRSGATKWHGGSGESEDERWVESQRERPGGRGMIYDFFQIGSGNFWGR